ncbi:hypothetical protein SLEP1_g41743 [Rubroshorea leprosula]|uniref:Uncharacterized protein n=1 Tax=Rubroshorea leprosula TaxID=152421 RepID=A0AAV5L808_9ROSI|nr:hypothetical protein SLEP1_g41743 [Rubroshorea leprosula]
MWQTKGVWRGNRKMGMESPKQRNKSHNWIARCTWMGINLFAIFAGDGLSGTWFKSLPRPCFSWFWCGQFFRLNIVGI